MAKSKHKTEVIHVVGSSDFFIRKYLFLIIVFSFSFLLYANTISNDYNLDDELVTRNHKLTSKGVESIPQIFSSAYYSDDMGYAFEYRPMVHVTFAIEHQLFGDSPHVSHFINAVLYSCMCLLLFSFLKHLFWRENIFLSLLITLLFAAHPVHTEVVASIKNRDEMLALFFSIASWYVILKYSEKKLAWAVVGGSAFFLMALLSKISVFGFVIIIPLSLLFFQRLPLYKTVIILIALFTPAFFIINVMQPQFKLLLFAIIAGVLYVGYILALSLRKNGASKQGLASLVLDAKEFLREEVFPFNHRFFFPGMCAALMFLLGGNVYFFTQTGNYSGLIVLSGICLLLSVRAKGIFKWLLLLSFQLTVAFMQYLISEQFAYIIFLTWCYLGWSFTRSNAIQEKLIFGSLLLVSIPLSLLIHLYPFPSFLFIVLVSLVPFVYPAAEKYRKYLLALIIVVLSLGFVRDIFERAVYPVSLVPITIVYLLLVNFPNQLRVKRSWLTVLFFLAHFFLAFTSKINYNHLHQVSTLKSKFSEGAFHPSETATPSAPQPSQTANPVSLTILPKDVSGNVNRPLDFVENPVTAKDPLSVKVASALDVMLKYLKLLVVAYPLSYYYGYKVIEPVKISDPIVIASIVIHLLLLFVALYFFLQSKLVPLFGILVYFIFILQFTNIFQAVPGMMGDRYLLVPSLGFCMVVAYLLFRLLKLEQLSALSQMIKPLRLVVVFVLLVYSAITVARNRDWKDSLTLFKNDIKHLDESAQAHNLLGLHLLNYANTLDEKMLQKQTREEAAMHHKRALEIYPEFFNVAYDLGRGYLQSEQLDSALAYFLTALKLDTTYVELPINIGEIYYSKGRYADAVPYFEMAMRQQPTYYKGYDKLSYLYFTVKEFDKSLEVNKAATRYMPTFIEPLANIGRTFMGMNQPDSARIYFEKALQLEPNNQSVLQLMRQAGFR